MYGYHMPGLTGLLVIIVIGIVIYRLVAGMPEGNNKYKGMSAREILDARYASGEINTETYEEQKKNLEK